jgi:hypothetical protein
VCDVKHPRQLMRNRVISLITLSLLGLGTVSLTRAYLLRNHGASQGGLVADRRVVRLSGANREEQEDLASFNLSNQGRRTLVIERVSSTCTCVAVGDVAGVRIEPGQSYRLDFRVRLPPVGISTTNVDIYHSGDPNPLALRIEAVGSRALPVIKAIHNGSPTFIALRSPGETSEVVIATREVIGSQHWLTALTCDLDAVKIVPGDVIESVQESSGFIDREYHYGITWHALPTAPEFRGQIQAMTSRNEELFIPVGSVTGSLADLRPFSPTVVLLGLDRRSETILFKPDSGVWSISDKATLPSWLVADWHLVDGRRRLIISLREQHVVSAAKHTLLLVNHEGRTAGIEILCRLSPDP